MTPVHKHNPAIAIVTPVWNGMPFIKECINSVLNQSFSDWELLVGDNCSTDGTRDYLDSLRDPRIRVFKHAENRRIYGNLNFLFSHVRAPVSQFLCADDFFSASDSLDKILARWREAPVDVGFMRSNWVRPSRDVLNIHAHEILPDHVRPSQSDLAFFTFGCVAGNLSNVAVRTEVVNATGRFREDLPYTGDFEFWTRAGRRFGFDLHRREVIYVRRHEGTASNYLNRAGELVNQNAIIIQELYERLANCARSQTLRRHAMTNYDALARDMGIQLWVRNRSLTYLREVDRAAQRYSVFTANRLAQWFIYMKTFGGRIGRVESARRVLDGTFAPRSLAGRVVQERK